jgi:hypothetical protein
MSSKSRSEEDASSGKQSAGPLEGVDQSLSPTLPPISNSADGDGKRNIAAINPDKPYSVFTYREKWLIVSVASYAALFR